MIDKKNLIKQWTPPAFLDLFRSMSNRTIRMSGNYSNWEDVMAQCEGYNQSVIFEKTLASALQVKNGLKPYERDSVLFDRIVYSWPILTSLLWTATQYAGKLRVLDFGGALGTSYFQNKKFIDHLDEVSWNIVEQPKMAELGSKYLQDNILSFSSSIEEGFHSCSPNFVLLSSSLQYVQEPFNVIDDLAIRNVPVIALDKTPFLKNDQKTFIQKQSVPSQIYPASYPCYLFNEHEIIQKFEDHSYRLIETFHCQDHLTNKAIWKGMILRKTS